MEIKRVIEILSDKGMPDLVGGYDFDYDYDEYEEACNTAIQELEKIEKGVVPVDWHNSVYETIQKRYLDLLERTRWIQVSERLPEEKTYVLFWGFNDWIVARHYGEPYLYDTVGECYPIKFYTHWMTLPEPPKEVE